MATIIQKNKYIVGNNLQNEVFGHNRWLRFAGFVLLCLGITTIIIPLMPALHSIAVLSGLLAVSGVIYIAHAVAFWQHRWLGFSLHAVAGIVYLMAGVLIFLYPLADVMVLAEILIASYLIVGIFRITIAMGQGIANLGWGWTLLCGLIDIALAYFIWTQLPTLNSGLLGLIIGVELLFTGWALFTLGTNAKRELKSYSA